MLTIGGVLVNVDLVGDERGTLRLSGIVESFAIGGQEFWVDRLCKNIGSSGSTQVGTQVYLDFEENEPGTTFVPDESFTAIGTDGKEMLVTVSPFISNGEPLSGSAIFDGQGIAGGSGVDINLSNVNLNFSFDDPLDGLSLLFGGFGGGLNITINGEFRSANDMFEFNTESPVAFVAECQRLGQPYQVLQNGERWTWTPG